MNRVWHTLRVLSANLLWFLSCVPGWMIFLWATRSVRRAQTVVLSGILRRNAETEIGAVHRFGSIRGPEEFRSVPLSEYEDYVAAIERTKAGHPSVLTCDPVELLQPTSGSTAATKLIPYTASLRKEFRAAIDPWIASLYLSHPALLLGRHYWSISPTTPWRTESPAKVRVGFADDAEYLGRIQRLLSRTLFAIPSEIARIADPDTFEYLTLLFLLREKNLRVISVWHPSFLTLLTAAARKRLPSIVRDIESGALADDVTLSPGLRAVFSSRIFSNPARAKELRQLDTAQPDFPGRLWPHLRVISCWTDGRSEPWVAELVRQFPRAEIQGKGLTATEGIVSFPIGRQGRRVCAIRSHFLEFVDTGTGDVRRAWEIRPHRLYSVVLSTGGGLYRYRLHDLVKVKGYFNRAPCLEFLSRDNLVSDVVGEKLNGKHVEESIRRVEESCGARFAFAMLAPCPARQTVGYVFIVQAQVGKDVDYRRAGILLESELSRNFHYRHARERSQLQPLRVFRVEGDAGAAYRRFLVQKGAKAGDVKFGALSFDAGWASALEGEYVDQSGGAEHRAPLPPVPHTASGIGNASQCLPCCSSSVDDKSSVRPAAVPLGKQDCRPSSTK